MNVDKMRRYHPRTMPRPAESITVGRDELRAHMDGALRAFESGRDDYPPPHPYEEWRGAIRRYCEAKGTRSEILVNGQPIGETSRDDDLPETLTFTWRER